MTKLEKEIMEDINRLLHEALQMLNYSLCAESKFCKDCLIYRAWKAQDNNDYSGRLCGTLVNVVDQSEDVLEWAKEQERGKEADHAT